MDCDEIAALVPLVVLTVKNQLIGYCKSNELRSLPNRHRLTFADGSIARGKGLRRGDVATH
jgi:hypothetical protein